ncbi:hypothetical protein SS1G_11617 [Sclerotinia sclerotiorum 1980 UF-70]|uniref:Uncharacterized protein n=1 Tax=Sclerotinia sclerotiorum (strain ATCC 18683 / 1980 / Ss-1) TaxID=665079 RepID=A7F1Z6_SCLS1|nr:hypothetical protein SS1G_11617 [Sclerotinia sclerotiorum 1980 UF-70]EDN95738.1 hypothetical protein SS1G_11617 [Sclerotinia sclerotiorum 1980 UF-70]
MKRFKFVSDNSSSASQPVRSKSTKMNRKPRSEDHCIDDTQIARILSNKTTTVTGAFISVLEVKDTRYDIGVYGNFLAEIPRRLVTSAALDASSDENTNHGEMLIYLLNAGAAQGWKDNAIGIQSLKLQVLAKVPEYLRNLEIHLPVIKSTYHQMKIDLSTLRHSLENLGRAPHTKTLHSRFQAVYSLILAFTNILNTFLRAFPHDDNSLLPESVAYFDETISLAEDALQYRPSGSSTMPLVPTSAWVATNDSSRRSKVEKLLEEYQSDFSILNWMEIAFWLEARRGSVYASFQNYGVTTAKLSNGI